MEKTKTWAQRAGAAVVGASAVLGGGCGEKSTEPTSNAVVATTADKAKALEIVGGEIFSVIENITRNYIKAEEDKNTENRGFITASVTGIDYATQNFHALRTLGTVPGERYGYVQLANDLIPLGDINPGVKQAITDILCSIEQTGQVPPGINTTEEIKAAGPLLQKAAAEVRDWVTGGITPTNANAEVGRSR